MGGFYGSIHCRTENRQEVIENVDHVARKLQTRFLVGPPIAGWVSVYPDNGGQDQRVSKALSKRLSCPLIHVLVHDDDLLAYFYYREHQLVDKFCSRPDFFRGMSPRERREYCGHPELLTEFLAEESHIAELQDLITQDESKQPLFAVDSLERFAELLKLPNAVTSYEYLRERDPRDPLPWDIVDAGIDREFLLSEREKARTGETTPDCRAAGCTSCGACPPGLSNITYPGRLGDLPAADEGTDPATHPPASAAQRHVVRLSYAKEGPAKYLSGLEIQSLWGRVFRRAGLPLAYSQGFNPSPKLSLSPALAVGAESDVEFLEAEFSLPVPPGDVPGKLVPHLPAGIRVTGATGIPPGSPRLSDYDIASVWSLRPVPPFPLPGEVTPGRAAERLAAFRAADSHPLVLTREDRTSEIDLKPIVRTFGVNPEGISITIIQGTGKGVRPLEAAASLLGVPLSPERFIPRKVSAELIPRRG